MQPHAGARRSARPAPRRDARCASGPRSVERRARRARRRWRRTTRRRAARCPASVSSSAAAVVEHEPGLAAARLGRLLLVDEQAAALHQVHDERDRLEVEQQVLAAAADAARAAGRRPRRARGTAVFSAVNVSGTKRGQRGAGELARSAARRGLGPRAARARQSSVGTRSARDRREHGVEGARTPAALSSSFCWSPVSRMRPVDERLLRVELAGGDGRRRSPSPAPCGRARLGRPGAERARRRRRPAGGRSTSPSGPSDTTCVTADRAARSSRRLHLRAGGHLGVSASIQSRLRYRTTADSLPGRRPRSVRRRGGHRPAGPRCSTSPPVQGELAGARDARRRARR